MPYNIASARNPSVVLISSERYCVEYHFKRAHIDTAISYLICDLYHCLLIPICLLSIMRLQVCQYEIIIIFNSHVLYIIYTSFNFCFAECFYWVGHLLFISDGLRAERGDRVASVMDFRSGDSKLKSSVVLNTGLGLSFPGASVELTQLID